MRTRDDGVGVAGGERGGGVGGSRLRLSKGILSLCPEEQDARTNPLSWRQTPTRVGNRRNLTVLLRKRQGGMPPTPAPA